VSAPATTRTARSGGTTAPSTQVPRPSGSRAPSTPVGRPRWPASQEQAGLRRNRRLCIEPFLTEHLQGKKGREQRTVDDCRRLDLKWFSPEIGRRRVKDVDEATIDRIFGRMRRAGLSRSRVNHARSLYAPFSRRLVVPPAERRSGRRSPARSPHHQGSARLPWTSSEHASIVPPAVQRHTGGS